MISFMVFFSEPVFSRCYVVSENIHTRDRRGFVLTDAAYRKLHNTLSLLVFQVVV